jgi:uncharacterized membrane protein YphA (DoxX/SURF4 family)
MPEHPESSSDSSTIPPPAGQLEPGRASLLLKAQPWITLALRLGIGAVGLGAAVPKFFDLRQSQLATAAYQIMPVELSRIVGVVLPVVELAVALLLVAGLLTRYAAALFGLMMVAFVIGIAQAWARGLTIDCGCFGGGGELPPGVAASYGLDIARDLFFLAGAAIVMRWPRSALSLDGVLRLVPDERTSI